MTKTKSARQVTYQRGLWAEKITALYLLCKGYRILEHRYKTAVGEIDLIVSRHNLPFFRTHKKQIIFVEVKYRQSERQALESITASMRRRIEKAALHYIAQKNIEDCPMQFDVVLISKPFFIRHLDNVWVAGA